MTTYIIRRLIQTVFLLFLLSIIFFLLVRAGGQISSCTTFGCELQQHLDQPITSQYLIYVGNLLHANFGTESGDIPLGTEIVQKLPPTIILVAVSFVFQQLLALPLGAVVLDDPAEAGMVGAGGGAHLGFHALPQRRAPSVAASTGSAIAVAQTPAAAVSFILNVLGWKQEAYRPTFGRQAAVPIVSCSRHPTA